MRIFPASIALFRAPMQDFAARLRAQAYGCRIPRKKPQAALDFPL